MQQTPRNPRAGLPSFEAKLENEDEILDALLAALTKNQLDPQLWSDLHSAAVRDDRVSELAFAYESFAQGRKLRTLLPAVQAELYFRAATFFGDVLGDDVGATTYLERALGAHPAHSGAFERIDATLTRTDENRKLADLCVSTAGHRPKLEQPDLLRRAAVLYERAGLDDKAIETYQQLIRIDPRDEGLRSALEARYLKANRFRDIARMFEQALSVDPPPDAIEGAQIRAKLIDVFANQLKEPERAMPHVEAVLEVDPTHPEARRVATRLLESKGLAARAAAALVAGAQNVDERAHYLGVELENTRGPRRRDVLFRIGILRQDELGDHAGAFDAFEQALGIDPTDDELRRRYIELGVAQKGPLEVARTFARVSTVAKDPAVRSRITAEMGDLLLRGGDTKRARTTLTGVLGADLDARAVLTAARAMAGVYEADRDTKSLLDVLARIGELSDDDAERQRANERIAATCAETGDVDRAVAAWRRLVDGAARDRALAALEPLYEQRKEWADLAFVLAERAKDTQSQVEARKLSFRAADILSTMTKDAKAASDAWRSMIDAYGPARDIYARWIPILEGERNWADVAAALSNDAELAPPEERATVLAHLGNVYLARTKEPEAALEAFRRALDADPTEKTSRATLEKLLASGDHRLIAADVLEPIFRRENDATALLRVLDVKAQLSPAPDDQLAALAEASEVASAVSKDRALDFVGRGLALAVETGGDIDTWLARFDAVSTDADPSRKAPLLGKALGERDVDSPTLATLAKRVGAEYASCGDVPLALAAYRRALAFDPSSAELISRVDELLRESGNAEERVALYRAALERGPDPVRRRQLLHSIGTIERYELSNLDGAILAYKRALKDDPSDLAAHSALVELYTETEAWNDVMETLSERLPRAASPEEARSVRAELADVAARHGQPERAKESVERLLQEETLGDAELELAVRVAETIDDTNLLRAVLERRVRDASDARQELEAHERLASLAEQADDTESAVDHLRMAARIARELEDDATASRLYSKLRSLRARDDEAARELVGLSERTGDFARLPELYETLLELASDDDTRVKWLRGLATAYAEKLNDVKRAFDAAQRAFRIAPEDKEVLAEVEALATRGALSKDLARVIDEVVANFPEDAKSTVAELGLAKARALASSPETWSEATRAFRAVLEESRTTEGAADEAHVAAATEGFEALLRHRPASDERSEDVRWLFGWRVDRTAPEARARLLLSWAENEEKELADPSRALVLYRRVLEMDPDNLDALSAVSRLSLEQGDVEGALAALTTRRNASEGAQRNALDLQIATILSATPGRAGQAVDRIAAVLETSPHEPQALELAAKLLGDSEAGGRAAAVLERSIDAIEEPLVRVDILKRLITEAAPRLDLYERLLELFTELERTQEAYELVLKAAQALPREAALWDRAERLARQLTSPDALALLYEQVLRGELSKEEAIELGQRAVAFYEEWFEDGGRVVGILERLLEIEPRDTWAFDRLKLIFDAEERWDDLFALYDRAAADADDDRRVELYEEAAQIAKDFANHSSRAIGYFEKLLELRPSNARLSAALERLYERHGCYRELVGLLGARLPSLSAADAQRERGRIASLWLNELGDAASALIVIEDMLAQPDVAPAAELDVTDLLERVLSLAPKTAEMRDSLPPPPEGSPRRDSYLPTSTKRGLVRQRAAALLRERYKGQGREADLVRVLEVELEAVKSVKERIKRHHKIASIYGQLGDDTNALEHFVQLVLLEPEVAAHRTELATIAERTGLFGRFADVLVSAAEDRNDDALKVELLLAAGITTAEKIGDTQRAIELFFRIIGTEGVADEALLEACRNAEPLLAQSGRRAERLDVLERLAILEADVEVRSRVLGEAARLATDLGEDERAIWAWEGRLEAVPQDPEALDGLTLLFDKVERWRPLIDVLERRAKLERAEDARRSDRVRVAQILSEKLEASEEAIEVWQTIESAFGESDEGTRALSALYRSRKRWSDLASLLARASERTEAAGEKAELLRDLGDAQREHLDIPEEAIKSYEQALSFDPRSEGARGGLRALLKRAEHRPEAVRVLLAAYAAADDWRLILDLTEHRLTSEKSVAGQIAILMEAKELSEVRAEDRSAAFVLVRRAILLAPDNERTLEELFRLAEATRNYRSLADALRECLDADMPEKPWAKALRFRMGDVLETHLDEPRAALDAFVLVVEEDALDLDAARAVVRIAGRTTRWDAAARALVDVTRAKGELVTELVNAVEESAAGANGWDAVTFALAALVHDGGGLSSALARDVEATIAAWHRDKRGDPDAAEAAYARALGHDPSNTKLLADIAQLQRRAKGRPLVESLLRLSQTTGGDLDLLTEAAEVASTSVGDRALAKSIFERLLRLASERWLGADADVSAGAPGSPSTYVDRAVRELVQIHSDDGSHDDVVTLLVETARLPWDKQKTRDLRHQAAAVAESRLAATDRAIAIYLGLIEEDPRDASAVSHLVALYETHGRRAELLELKRRLVRTAASEEERLTLRLEAARLEDELEKVDSAIATLEENLRESPRHTDTVSAIEMILTRERRFADLEKLYAKQALLAEGAGESGAAADLHGRAAEVAEARLGNVPAAIAHLKRVVELEPRTHALDALARLSISARENEAAAGYLDRLRDLCEDRVRAAVTLRLADALIAAGRNSDARDRLESEVSRDPEADEVRTRLADIYRATEEWSALARLLTDGATHAPDKTTRFSRLREAAELHRNRTGQPELAIPLLEQAADLSPDDNPVKLGLADALGAAGRYEEARTLLRGLVDAFGGRRPKERAPVHYHLARLDLTVGDRARALVELDAATKIDPANAEILRTLAELARDDGQLERAERSYRALLTVLRRLEDVSDETPITRCEAMFELSQIAIRQGETDRANEILESALELAREHTIEAKRLERALRRQGDHANLARALETRLGRNQAADDAEVFAELGRLYEEHLGKPESALEMRLRALDLAPAADDAHEAAERLATTLGNVAAYESRVRALATASTTNSDVASALFIRLARMSETRGDDKEAASFYDRAMASASRNRDVLTALDRVYERLGDEAGQARVLGLRVALDADEGHASSDTLYRLAQLRFRSNDVDAACDAFEQAFDASPDETRAEELLKSAAAAQPKNERILAIYERLARAPGKERMLVDALERKWALSGSSREAMQEAVETAQKLGDAELSESLLRRWLERGEEDRDGRVFALTLLSRICEGKGQAREAVVLKREAAEIAEPEEGRALLFDVARLASDALADLHLSASVYEQLHERDPVDREAWGPLLDVYRRMGDFEKLTHLLSSVTGYVDDVQERSKLRLERIRIAMAKLGLSDDDAATELREIVDEDGTAVDAAILLGTILERSGREDDLAELLSRQLDAAKDREEGAAVASLSKRLGQLLETRDRAQARDVYYTALDWDPKARDVLVALERMHEADGEAEQRAEIMERRLALESGADAEQLALALAEIRREAGEGEAAVRALEVGFVAAPQSAELRSRLETLYREQLEFQKLAELYVIDASARTEARDKATRLREAARIYSQELTSPADAARVLRMAREADPTDMDLVGELVNMLAGAGELEAATSELTASIDALSEDDAARGYLLGRRAVMRSQLGDPEALGDFEDAVDAGTPDLLGPFIEHLQKLAMQAASQNDVATWRDHRLRMADLYMQMSNVEEAKNVLVELAKTDSKDKATLRALARIDELEERWDAASATYRRLVGVEDSDGIVSAALKLAEVCEKAGRPADARGGLERARVAAPQDVELRQRLAALYEQLGAIKELAELTLEEARSTGDVGPRFAGLVRAGQLLLTHTQDPNATAQVTVSAAIAPLEEAHALRPNDLDCAALLSDAYVGSGRLQEGYDLLQRTIASFKGRRARELSAFYHRLARLSEVSNDRAGELAHLVTALDMDGQNGVVASELAYRAMELENWEVAQRALRAVTMLKTRAPLPKALAYQHLGEIARHQGDTKRAVLLLKRAIDDDPTLESARALLDVLSAEG